MPADTEYGVLDNAPVNFFTMIPHLIDDADISPQAKALYLHLKRVTGEDGTCWKTQDQLSKHCGFSTKTIVSAKRELIKAKIIKVELEAFEGHPRHIIHLLNLWTENERKYRQSVSNETDNNVKGKPQSVSNETAIGFRPRVTKNTPEEEPLKKNHEKKVPSLSKVPIFAEVQKILGYPEKTDKDPIPNYGKESKFIARMKARGYSEEDILAYWRIRIAAAGGYVEAWKVNEDIGKPRPRQISLLPTESALESDARSKGVAV